MNDQIQTKPLDPQVSVERIESFTQADLHDLCDATDEGIKAGGGFGWVEIPARDVLERFWQGVLAMPARRLFVARLDGVICGACQLIKKPANNEAQSHIVQLSTNFIAPWARGHGLARLLVEEVQRAASDEGAAVINLDVRETMKAAIRLYESLGYTRCGEHPYYARVNGKFIKGYYYYKVIDPKVLEQNS